MIQGYPIHRNPSQQNPAPMGSKILGPAGVLAGLVAADCGRGA